MGARMSPFRRLPPADNHGEKSMRFFVGSRMKERPMNAIAKGTATFRFARFAAVIASLTGLTAGCGTPGTGVGSSSATPPGSLSSIPPVEGTLSSAPDSSTARYGVRLDVVENGTTLRTTEGHTYQLGDHVTYAVRVPVGWLYGRNDVESSINLLRPDGTSIALSATMFRQGLEMPASAVVSSDGTRLAWSKTGTVYTGQISATGLQTVTSSPVPGDTYPLLWAGNRIVLGKTYNDGCCGYRRADYDVWDPTAGTFIPHWTRDLWPVYGPVPAGVPLFSIHSSEDTGHGCLVQLDGVKDLSTAATACVPGITLGSLRGLLSPDGKHLMEGVGEQGQIFDLTTVITTSSALRTCPGDWGIAWEDSNTVLVGSSPTHALSRCYVDGSAPTPVSGPAVGRPGAGDATILVPRFG
jgi:hypothetical protein